ncbi:MAG: hypothetical protein AAF222_03455 [Pseudomonadota bacterium]
MTEDKRDEAALEAFFDASRSHAPVPDDTFLARLSADAERVDLQTEKTFAAPRMVSPFARFKGLFAASGLSGVAALGLWLGFIMPDIVTNLSPLSEDVTTLSAFLPGSDLSVLSE